VTDGNAMNEISHSGLTETEKPDFYLSSHDIEPPLSPRRCYAIKRLRGKVRDDYLLIRIDPPLIGQPYGMGGRDIDQVIVATRHEGASLFPIRDWPVFVHVARPLIEHPEQRDHVAFYEMQNIIWGELYKTQQDAEGGLERALLASHAVESGWWSFVLRILRWFD
jgi:hypothetical protein